MKNHLLSLVVFAAAVVAGCRTPANSSGVKDAIVPSQPDSPDHNCQVVMVSADWGSTASTGQMGWTFTTAVPLSALQTGYDVAIKYSLQGEDWKTIGATPDHTDGTWSYFVARLVPPGGGGPSMYLNAIAYLNENNVAHVYDHNWGQDDNGSLLLNQANNWTANPVPSRCNVPNLPAVTKSPMTISCSTNSDPNHGDTNYELNLRSTDGINFTGSLERLSGSDISTVATFKNVKFTGANGYRNYNGGGLALSMTPKAAPGNGGYLSSLSAGKIVIPNQNNAVCN